MSYGCPPPKPGEVVCCCTAPKVCQADSGACLDPVGTACLDGTTCISHSCSNAACDPTCTVDSECDGRFCDDTTSPAVCRDKHVLGAACSKTEACTEGTCSSGTCILAGTTPPGAPGATPGAPASTTSSSTPSSVNDDGGCSMSNATSGAAWVLAIVIGLVVMRRRAS